ncbi:MAG TPA: GerMN domain-containing protein [Thermomicrobiaceae bacterium]|nr:GerMN domain-containing protein [Thermomicrobiaceae bacterium]
MAKVRVVGLMLAVVVLLACSGPVAPDAAPPGEDTVVPTAQPIATATETATEPATIIPTVAPTATPTALPTPTPTPPQAATPAATPTAVTGTPFEVPAPGARVTLPLHVLAHVGNPGDKITTVLRWQDGTQRTDTLTALKDVDGRGLVIGTPSWWPDTPPQPKTQPATLELHDSSGVVLAKQSIMVLDPSDPGTQQIRLFWTVSGSDTVVAETRTVLKTEEIGTAALQELLWGPPPASNLGFGTAIPTPEQVLSFTGRQSSWGARVTLRGLTIANGVATADFSREMDAYGGGSLRVKQIHDQIDQTLRQFPSVQQTVIAIEGKTDGVLQP